MTHRTTAVVKTMEDLPEVLVGDALPIHAYSTLALSGTPLTPT